MSIALLSRRIDVASALLRVRAFAAAATAASAAAPAAAAAPKTDKKAAEKEKKASRADKKAAKLSASSESGDAQWDAFNAPMIVQKEPAIAVIDMDYAAASRVGPSDKLRIRSAGLMVHEPAAMFPRPGQNSSNTRPPTGGSFAKRAVVFLPFPTPKVGDAHLFSHSSGTNWAVVACATHAGQDASLRLLPAAAELPAHVKPITATGSGHPFNTAFHTTYYTGDGPSRSPKTVEYDGLIATLSRVAEQVGSTKAAAARTVHVHSASVDLVYVMNLPNAFDQASAHPAVKLRALVESLAAVNVQVKFHHQTTKLRYGERKLMHEWLRLSARIARRQALFAKERRSAQRLINAVQKMMSEHGELQEVAKENKIVMSSEAQKTAQAAGVAL